MFKWLKKKPQAPKNEQVPYGLHVERRQHARILYPRSGAMAELPFISFKGAQLQPLNLSMGGFLMSHATLNDLQTGEIYELTFKWNGSDREINQKAKLVRVTPRGCHFKFEDLNPQLLVNLSLALKPGVRAQKTSLVDVTLTKDERACEYWLSNSGEQLIFYSQEGAEPDVKIKLPPKELYYHPEKGLLVGVRETPVAELKFETPAPQWLLHDLIVLLSNLPNTSPRIDALLERLEKLL